MSYVSATRLETLAPFSSIKVEETTLENSILVEETVRNCAA
jgi:hypothetical protein